MAKRIFEILQKHVELKFTSRMAKHSVGRKDWKDIYDQWLAESRVEWDRTLNIMNIKRLEYHLKLREPSEGVVRIIDPFMIAFKRYLDIPMETVDKILVFGIPS